MSKALRTASSRASLRGLRKRSGRAASSLSTCRVRSGGRIALPIWLHEATARNAGRAAIRFSCAIRGVGLAAVPVEENTMATEHFDVVIIGAGLSGIGAGYHLQTKCPSKSFVILEGRDAIGGTWDLFRYPGIRSDSDMFTLGYSFKPWTDPKAIADGPRILNYVCETATENGIDKKIRFRHRVRRASWSTKEARWTVDAERTSGEGLSETVTFTCSFLFCCA